MRRVLYWLIAAVLGVGLLGTSLVLARADREEKGAKAGAKERAVTIDQVPKAVKKTILKQAGEHKIREIEQVTKGGKTFYEAEWIAGGKEIDIQVAPDGKLLGREVEQADEEEEQEAENGREVEDEDEADDEGEDEDEDEADDEGEDEDEDEADDEGEDEDEDEADDEDEDEDEEGEEGERGKETERQVTAADVPKAALAALKKLAAGAEITGFSEEVEYGHTFYEGSWKARSGGNMDVLVTPTGDLVEIEERIAAEDVPRAVLAAARKAAGAKAPLAFEKKTMLLYEVKFSKEDRRHELLLTPDGRRAQEEVEKRKAGKDDDAEDEDEDEDEDDDDRE